MITRGQIVAVPTPNGTFRGKVIELHGPVAKCSYWNGKRFETISVKTSDLKEWKEQ